ncbi:MAG: cupin domain-containing protein [Candidatus Omnitrophica bacterium]|nr:cupin domain-containing protein [Candidatus Omnitrophota bacterium]MCB9720964.1 cupin domain-containing protein [Candidatus Omnitrophota bacterium]
MNTPLNHPGIEMTLIVDPASVDGKLCAYEEKTDVNSGPPLHIHHRQHEIFQVLEGQYRFFLEGEERLLGPGQTAVVRPGQTHAFKAVSPHGARMRFDLIPALKSTEFFAMLPQVIKDGGDVPALFRQFDSELVGPPLS